MHDHGLLAIYRQISHNCSESFGKPCADLLYSSATSSNKPIMCTDNVLHNCMRYLHYTCVCLVIAIHNGYPKLYIAGCIVIFFTYCYIFNALEKDNAASNM